MESSSEREVASVGEGRDHQATCVAQILEAVRKLRVDGANEQEVVVPVVPRDVMNRKSSCQ